MNIELEITQLILEPKKKILIDSLTSIVRGNEDNYIPEISNPNYLEIWFYHSFDFNYVVIGKENFAIKIGMDSDQELLNSIFFKNNLSIESDEKVISDLKQKCEFSFFSDCWIEIEKKIGRKVRCFLIEHGIIRGWDVNRRKLIDGEEIGDILNKEGIPNHY